MPMKGQRTARARVHCDKYGWVEIVAKARVGGMYADLYFNGAATPIEVINLWNYETGKSDFVEPATSLPVILSNWIAAEVDEETAWRKQGNTIRKNEWLEGYVENNQFS
jgi:hypothetical protein